MTLITLIATLMMFNMPTLPYVHNALEPVISQATIDFHYGKHLQTYVNNLNSLVPGTEFEGKTLEEIVATAPDGPIFNNAGQVLNHTFYFLQFSPAPARHEPEGPLADAIRRDFGSFDNFKKEFTAAATGLFGSGWAWLSADKDGKLNEAEMTQLKADADKALEARRAARREARKAARGNDTPPPAPAPAEEGE